MSITRKTAIYTSLTTLLIGLLIISYFLWMLPGLYTKYKMDKYLQTVEDVQRRFIKGKTFADGYQLSDNFVLTSVKLPATGEKLQVSTPNASFDITLKAPELQSFYKELQTVFQSIDEENNEKLFNSVDFEPVKDFFEEMYQTLNQETVEIQNIETYPFKIIDGSENEDIYMTADDILIIGGTIEQNTTSYASYYAVKEEKGDIYVTFASAMTPKLNELVPIVLQSIPMIVAVLVVLSLLIARWFSRKLAKPVELLASQARNRKDEKQVFQQPNKGDEFEVLENALNQMHHELQENLLQLHQQNHQLEEMNQKQRLLLTNASHQLKTPIATASLLIESMIHKVGKYRDRDTYLPDILKQIQQMQLIVQQLMYLFEEPTQEVNESLAIDALIHQVWQNYEAKSHQRQLSVEIEVVPVTIETSELFVSIVDNLVQNAVKYTPRGHRILIQLTSNNLRVVSQGAKIQPQLIAHIQEPFIRDNSEEEAGTGLGLYLVDRFVRMLGMRWEIKNTEQGVETLVEWRNEHDYN
ncbi:HAMP domain-containing histidine kinase [Enterococcus saccharolyticus]|uniref:histidine kinase n=1 Tax=Candidatus Enterococcus willemsii TaxID=1857215 RepID=A0ABQ6Z244_9ENTE|nr:MULTISPECIES: HAMP domain-containing sensor histidine kinase [Enterococcus]KAF1305086.1 hypothetical protein BAU17_04735 [Enterococcus sp. CU12B]MCD5002540.1 HAMP domain-containing histidine kinase [Enterococcus saccharolyticus]